MKKIIYTAALLFIYSASQAQNVGINTTGAAPDAGAGLDVNYTNKGVLIPRVNIADLTTIAPVVGSSTESMLVYNTNATTGTGYHYWDGARWVRLETSAWRTTGNAGTTAGTNFLGTTDNNALRIRTNNAERFEFTTNGRLRSFNGGSAGAPTYSWFADPNTGIWRPGNDILSFSTNSADRLRIIANGNIGINQINPTQRLHVNGNFRLQGAFMPNNQAGLANNILMSGGPGVPPVWSTFPILNTPEINAIGKFYSGNFNSANNTYLTYTVADPEMTETSSVSFNLVGPSIAAAGLLWGRNFTIMAIPEAGQVVFHVVNTSGFNFTNLEIVYHAFY